MTGTYGRFTLPLAPARHDAEERMDACRLKELIQLMPASQRFENQSAAFPFLLFVKPQNPRFSSAISI